MRHGEKRRRTAFPPAAAWPSPISPGLNHVTLLFEEKPACGRIRQDPVEGDEERRRWAEEKEEKGRGGGGGREEERRDEAWGLGIEDVRGLQLGFHPIPQRVERTGP